MKINQYIVTINKPDKDKDKYPYKFITTSTSEEQAILQTVTNEQCPKRIVSAKLLRTIYDSDTKS